MPKGSRRELRLSIVATDSSFERVTLRGGEAWQGNCIHCRRRLLIELSGEPIGAVTVEQILPRRHGGSDELVNLALACAPCNHQERATGSTTDELMIRSSCASSKLCAPDVSHAGVIHPDRPRAQRSVRGTIETADMLVRARRRSPVRRRLKRRTFSWRAWRRLGPGDG